jgi:hypothetical protein
MTFSMVANLLIGQDTLLGRPFWVLVGSAVHGLVALLVTAPTIWQLLPLAFLAGTLVDLDHFLVAGPRSFWAATHLEKRPPTHSLTLRSWSARVDTGSLEASPLLWPLDDWRTRFC